MQAPTSVSSSPVAPRDEAAPPVAAISAPKKRVGRSWIVSLTGICFLFGALLAMQLRTIQQVQENRLLDQQKQVAEAKLADEMREKAVIAERERAETQRKLEELQVSLKQRGSLNQSQVTALNAQISELQHMAGLTPITGAGIRMMLADNPDAAQDAGETAFLPGLVHDYDVLQVVNELRAAKAEAIAVTGAGGSPIRVTGTTPIRCVGPVIYINWQPVAAPFTVEAIGNPKTLQSALEMPGGMVDNLRAQGALKVKLETVKKMTLPASNSGAPTTTTMRVAQNSPLESQEPNRELSSAASASQSEDESQ